MPDVKLHTVVRSIRTVAGTPQFAQRTDRQLLLAFSAQGEQSAFAALVRDLEYIASQARLLLPIHDPSPAVWDNIQQALRESKPEPPASAARK